MIISQEQILSSIKCLYSEKKIARWGSNLYNAEIVVKKAFCYLDTFDLLKNTIFSEDLCLHTVVDFENESIDNIFGLSNFDLTYCPFYKSQLTQIEYFNTLFISKITYNDFICSALVFVIENYIENNNDLGLNILTEDLAFLLIVENNLFQDIFQVLYAVRIFDYSPNPILAGLLVFLLIIVLVMAIENFQKTILKLFL